VNKLVSDLWDQAAWSVAYKRNESNSWQTQVDFIEKFSELIVLKTLDAIEAERFELPPEVILAVKQRFGVE
jgi:hypothetical protein